MFTDLKNVVPPTIETMTETPPQLPPDHPAVKLGGELAQVHTQFDRLLEKLETQKRDFSSEYLKQERQAINQRRQAEIDTRLAKFLGVSNGQWGLTGGSIEAQMNDLQARLAKATEEAHLADKLDPARVSLARQQIEAMARTVANLGEFEAAYGSTNDPHIRRAFQMFGASIAAERWQGIPGVGSFSKRMERELSANFETDTSRQYRAKLDEVATTLWHLEGLTTQLRARSEGAQNAFAGGSNVWQARAQQLLQQLGALDFGVTNG